LTAPKSIIPRRPLVLIVKIIAGFILLVDGAMRPIYRPLIQRLAALKVLQALERSVAHMPRPLILVLFAVPFLIAEPLKLLALIMMAGGAFVPGLIVLVVAHLATFLVVERIYHAGRDKLRSYHWFDWGVQHVEAVRDVLVAWKKQSLDTVWRIVGHFHNDDF
jgi:hypothetical protein